MNEKYMNFFLWPSANYPYFFYNLLWFAAAFMLMENIRITGYNRHFHANMEYLRQECEEKLQDQDEMSKELDVLQRYGWYYRWIEAVSERKTREAHTERD